jgi:hypothetical protein
MKNSNLPLNRTLVLGLGALCAVACGGDSDNVGGNQGRLSASDATCEEPVAPTAEGHSIALWPPNHKLHTIAVDDCVSFTDACGAPASGEFIYATSDEPVDDIGDGHFSPDIGIDEAGNVCVRSERQGPKNGRVYHLGVRLVDDGGQESVAECTIIVDHDQSGAESQDDGESYRVTFDGTTELATCDHVEVGDGDGDSCGDGDGDDAGDGDGDGDGTGDGDGDGDATGDGDGDGDATGGDGDGDGDGTVVEPL